ncbi:hypothetical protein B0H19DRAFT_1247624 [Mycena capillaripes]|nr:hypothetical protein B0H19DRAFT_1247624 [Mycena capillaripes]
MISWIFGFSHAQNRADNEYRLWLARADHKYKLQLAEADHAHKFRLAELHSHEKKIAGGVDGGGGNGLIRGGDGGFGQGIHLTSDEVMFYDRFTGGTGGKSGAGGM